MTGPLLCTELTDNRSGRRFRFLVDTGANGTAISDATQGKISSYSQTETNLYMNGTIVKARSLRSSDLQIADSDSTIATAVVVDPWPSILSEYDGILGLSELKDKSFVIAGGDFSLANRLQTNSEAITRIPLRIIDNQAWIDVVINGHTVAALWDTGCNISFTIPQSMFQSVGLHPTSSRSTTLFRINGEVPVEMSIADADVVVAGMNFRTIVHGVDSAEVILLGINFFQGFTLQYSNSGLVLWRERR